MRSIIRKYLIDGDPLTAWLILKAPLLVALIYSIMAIRGNREAVLIAIFFFPYVFLLFKNLWLEILHDELLKKLKTESALETDLIKKLFRITRFGIAGLTIAAIYVVPAVMNSPVRPTLSDIPVMALAAIVLIFTLAVFIIQVRFTTHTGRLIYVLETKRKFDPAKEQGKNHSLKIANPATFRKYHDRIKSVLKKV